MRAEGANTSVVVVRYAIVLGAPNQTHIVVQQDLYRLSYITLLARTTAQVGRSIKAKVR
jgi:hypothetical protein